MPKFLKGAKLTLALVYLFMLILIALAVTLPWLVMWYVETKGRPADLATVVMVTCYPCSPLAFIALISAKNLLKNVINGDVFTQKNVKSLNTVCLCCLVAGLIMLIAGFFYMPFFIAAAAAVVCTLSFKIISDIFKTALNQNNATDKKEKATL